MGKTRTRQQTIRLQPADEIPDETDKFASDRASSDEPGSPSFPTAHKTISGNTESTDKTTKARSSGLSSIRNGTFEYE